MKGQHWTKARVSTSIGEDLTQSVLSPGQERTENGSIGQAKVSASIGEDLTQSVLSPGQECTENGSIGQARVSASIGEDMEAMDYDSFRD